jgi:hypothetical protein
MHKNISNSLFDFAVTMAQEESWGKKIHRRTIWDFFKAT